MKPKILVNASTNTINWLIWYETSSAIHGQIIIFIMRDYLIWPLSNVPSSAAVNTRNCVNVTVGEKKIVRTLEQMANVNYTEEELVNKNISGVYE
jgi:hypothetical protein